MTIPPGRGEFRYSFRHSLPVDGDQLPPDSPTLRARNAPLRDAVQFHFEQL